MKHFKFKTEVKVSGRHQTIKRVAATKKQRVTASQATELINERVVAMVKNALRQAEKLPESVINSIKFKTTVEALPVDFMIDLDIPMVEPKVSPEGVTAPSGEIN